MKTLELHYRMIQFLIKWFRRVRGPAATRASTWSEMCSCSLSVQEDLTGEQALIRFLV